MARLIVFDTRYTDVNGVGQAVDTSIRVAIFEQGQTVATETRVLGPDAAQNILLSSDAGGVFYTTTVDGTNFIKGDITVVWTATQNGTPLADFTEALPNVLEQRLTSNEIKNYVRQMLGFPAVAVELTSEHFTTIMEEALSLYGQWVPAERATSIDLNLGQNAYVLSHLPERGPFDVQFIRREGVPLISDPLFGREYPRGQQLDFDQYVLGISFWEMLNRVTSQEPEWWWDSNSRTLYVNIGGTNVAGASGNYFIMIRYFSTVEMSKVRNDHYRWFKRYALAQAKKILAQIRGKFTGQVPAPGGRFTLNFQQLMDEGKEEETALVEELRGMGMAVPPIHG
jgi:hypothetical protein